MHSDRAQNLLNWAIICPGPSLAKVQMNQIEADPDCIISVNGAILHPSGMLASYWAVVDPEVFATCQKKEDLRSYVAHTSIWTHFNFEHNGVENRIWDEHTHHIFKKFNTITWEHIDHYGQCTFFSAIYLAMKNGARTIRIYGVDMGGTGYFVDRLANDKTQHDDRRWREERARFEQILNECKEKGVHIVRR